MALGLEDKKAIVAEVNEAAKGALSAVVADSRGVTVANMTGLRKAAREAGVYIRVVRNTLVKRAVAGTDFECLSDTFTGPTLIAFSSEHPGAAARLLKDFAKAQEKFEIKAAAFEGELIPAENIGSFSKTTNLRRSTSSVHDDSKRSICWQVRSYIGRSTRSERSSLIILLAA